MRILINGQEVVIPSNLSEITLKQRIDYQEKHGNLLDEMLKSIAEIEDENLQELELGQFQFEKMFHTFAFFSGFEVEAIKEYEDLNKIASIYYECLYSIFDNENSMVPQKIFLWKKDTWILDEHELKNGSKTKFGELIDSKQIIQDMIGLGKNNWECLLPLCAIFLRKDGEPYLEAFMYEGSDRLELMQELPLNIALQVGFFLNIFLNMSLTTFLSSNLQRQNQEVEMLESTSSDLVG